MRNFLKFIIVSSWTSCLLSLSGCSGYSATGGVGKVVQPRLKTEVVQPSSLSQLDSILVAPLLFDDAVSAAHEPTLVGEFPFYDLLSRSALSHLTVEVHAGEEVLKLIGTARGVRADDSRFYPAAKKVNADGVLITKIHRFVERKGTRVGVEEPASIYFSMELVNATSRETIWRASYSFTDKALSENLFRIKDHFSKRDQPGWRTASDALSRGFDEATLDLNKHYSRVFIGSKSIGQG